MICGEREKYSWNIKKPKSMWMLLGFSLIL